MPPDLHGTNRSLVATGGGMEPSGQRLRLAMKQQAKLLDTQKNLPPFKLFLGHTSMSPELQALLDRVYARCIPDVHGCMNWTGAGTSSGKSPEIRIPNVKGSVSLRRLLIETAGCKKIGPSKRATYTCGNTKCVRLEHIGEITKRRLQERSNSQFDAATKLKKSKRISEKARARAKITIEIAKEIVSSSDSQRVLAKRYGVVQSTICQIKRGYTWREIGNNFFRI